MSAAGRRRFEQALFTLVYVFILFSATVAAGELTMRVLPRYLSDYQSGRFRQYDATLGVSLIPNTRVTHRRGCFHGDVLVNRWGMRDRERSLEKAVGSPRIALIGDSVVEGAHVRPDEVLNIRMERLLNRREGFETAEVLNFGIAGIGTTQELMMYADKVRRFSPDIVVLLFTDNDVINNSSTLQPRMYGIHEHYAPYFESAADGTLRYRPVKPRLLGDHWSALERRSALLYYLERVWARVNLPNRDWKGVPIQWGVYGEALEPAWIEAWDVTERVLARFDELVAQDGARFIILLWPAFFEIDPDWKTRLEDELGAVPAELEPPGFAKRLEAIARRHGIRFDSLAAFVRRYIGERDLSWPYLSLSCDPHPSPLGHQVGAEAIVDRLDAHGLLRDLS
jgi:lysophospholipase L1-like esterase